MGTLRVEGVALGHPGTTGAGRMVPMETPRWNEFTTLIQAERGMPPVAAEAEDVMAFLAHELGWRYQEIGQLVMWRSRGDAEPEEVDDAEAELAQEWEKLTAEVESLGGEMPKQELVRARVMGER